MSSSENENQPVTEENKQQPDLKAVAGPASNVLATVMKMKDEHPKLFFGVIGGVLVVIILLMTTGGRDSSPAAKLAIKELTAGQRYVLKSANAYDPLSTVRLVSTPGTIAAYDDTEAADRSGACQRMAQGTPVTALEFADAYGKKNTYVKVRIEEGECKGNTGWALAIDVK